MSHVDLKITNYFMDHPSYSTLCLGCSATKRKYGHFILLVTLFLIIREKLYRFETQTCTFSVCSHKKKTD